MLYGLAVAVLNVRLPSVIGVPLPALMKCSGLFGVVAPSPGVRRLLEAADAGGLLVDRGADGETQAPNVLSLAALPASTDT